MHGRPNYILAPPATDGYYQTNSVAITEKLANVAEGGGDHPFIVKGHSQASGMESFRNHRKAGRFKTNVPQPGHRVDFP